MMPGKESLYALACVLSGIVIGIGTFIALGGGPSPVLSLSMIVIGLGAALVVVRYGKLGPYQGAFGPPALEASLRARLRREVDRAARYDHDFSVLALRHRARRVRGIANHVRAADDVVYCRRGIAVVMLPETSAEGALRIHERISASTDEPFFAAIVSYPRDGETADEIAARLVSLVRDEYRPGKVVVSGATGVTTAPTPARA